MDRDVQTRIFRHGACDGRTYWVEMWEGAGGDLHVQRISIRGVGEFREPFGPLTSPQGDIEPLMVAARRFVEGSFGTRHARARPPADLELEAD